MKRKICRIDWKIPEAKTMMQSSSADDCVCVYNIEILNLFDPELQLNNTKPVIKINLKDLLADLKKFKVQTILVLENNNKDDQKSIRKLFHSLLMIQTLIKHFDQCTKALQGNKHVVNEY